VGAIRTRETQLAYGMAGGPLLMDSMLGWEGEKSMLPRSEALMRVCVLKVGQKGNWTWKDWTTWKLLWRFFPWYARNLRYRGFFCIANDCMYWQWENSVKERGFCSHADSRTTAAIWKQERDQGPPSMTGESEKVPGAF